MGLCVSSPPIDHLTIEPHSGLDLDVMKQIVQHVGGGGRGAGGGGGGEEGGEAGTLQLPPIFKIQRFHRVRGVPQITKQ